MISYNANPIRNAQKPSTSVEHSDITLTMSCAVPAACLRPLARNSLGHNALPTFLTPAFSRPQRPQCFSTSSPAQSRIGRAAVSIPPEVSLNFVNLPQGKMRGRATITPKLAVEVKGPLGWSGPLATMMDWF